MFVIYYMNSFLIRAHPQDPGRVRIQEEGIFYKSSRTGKTFQVRESEFSTFEWMRAARGYEVKIVNRDGAVTKFAGFKESVGVVL